MKWLKIMMNKKNKLSILTMLSLSVFCTSPAISAGNNALTEEGITAFYQDLNTARSKNDTAAMAFYQLHLDDNLNSVERITNIFPGDENGDEESTLEKPVGPQDEEIMKRNKAEFLNEAKTISQIVKYKDMIHTLQDVEISPDEQSARVSYRRISTFVMTRYGIRDPFNVFEDSLCKDDVSLMDDVIKVKSSDCTIKLRIDHR
jgi:hypothetical protein